MDVSIIIINYNTLQLTHNCIESVFAKTKNIDFEVILVDNASTDGSKEFFEKDERIKYIYSQENLGFGRGNNLGYKYAKGNYIFLLNSDTVLINNAIYELVTFMNNHFDITICGGQLFNTEMQKCHSYGLFLPSLKQEVDTLFRGLFSRKKRKHIESELLLNGYAVVGYITGADMLLRRDKVDEIGLFDPDFFMYYEETEMSRRYANKGYLSVFYPKAEIQHLEGKSFSFKESRERMFLESRRLYYTKGNYSLVYYYLCTTIYILYLLTSIIKDVFNNNIQSAKNTRKRIRFILSVE